MSLKNGYFLFDREKWSTETIAKSRSLSLLTFHLTTNATWKESTITWKGKPIVIPPGSCVVSITALAERWKESKTTLLRGLRTLRQRSMVVSESGPHGCIITLCNWNEIQNPPRCDGPPVVHARSESGPDSVLYELRSKKQETRKEESIEAVPELFPISIQEKRPPANGKHSPTGREGVSLFIGTYVKSFQRRYGDDARPDLGGKVQGQIKTLLKGLSIDRACSLIQVYLQMEVPWFNTKCHDISTFMQNLNPIGIALDTGQIQSSGTNWDKIKKELNIEN